MDIVGSDLRRQVDWDSRLDTNAFGSADGTFGDVVSATSDGRLDRLDLNTLLWSYGMLLGDTKTPKEVISRLLPPLTDTFTEVL